jgi:hypothetical protein
MEIIDHSMLRRKRTKTIIKIKKKQHDHLDPEIDLVVSLLLVHAGREGTRVEVEPVR